MSENPISYQLEGKVAALRFDDGKANAISHPAIDGLNAALDRAEQEAGAVLLLGRPDRFSAGFDLSTMKAGPDAVRSLVSGGAELLRRAFSETKERVRGASAERIRRSIADEMASLGGIV